MEIDFCDFSTWFREPETCDEDYFSHDIETLEKFFKLINFKLKRFSKTSRARENFFNEFPMSDGIEKKEEVFFWKNEY